VWAVAESGEFVEAASDKVWPVGRRPVVRVVLEGGFEIKATADHRLKRPDGWCRVDELRLGDWLQVVAPLPELVAPGGTVSTIDALWVNVNVNDARPGDSFPDRIVALEPAGEQEVYDLTVPGPSCWIANGIVSHNSGALEQDADLVVLIYRDDVYNKDPNNPDAGTAELILAKQRNGPTGVVKLAFLREQTRFANLAPGAAG
jgi:replicative DNA helicase